MIQRVVRWLGMLWLWDCLLGYVVCVLLLIIWSISWRHMQNWKWRTEGAFQRKLLYLEVYEIHEEHRRPLYTGIAARSSNMLLSRFLTSMINDGSQPFCYRLSFVQRLANPCLLCSKGPSVLFEKGSIQLAWDRPFCSGKLEACCWATTLLVCCSSSGYRWGILSVKASRISILCPSFIT